MKKLLLAASMTLISFSSFSQTVLSGNFDLSTSVRSVDGTNHAFVTLRSIVNTQAKVNSIHIGSNETPGLNIDINTSHSDSFSASRYEISYDLGNFINLVSNTENASALQNGAKAITLVTDPNAGCRTTECRKVPFPISFDISHGKDIEQKVFTALYIQYDYGNWLPDEITYNIEPPPELPITHSK